MNDKVQNPLINRVIVKGKVEAVEEYQGTVYTRVILPSIDEFSDTQLVQFRSNRRIASVGDMVEQPCSLGGWNQTFPRKDGGKGTRNTITLDIEL